LAPPAKKWGATFVVFGLIGIFISKLIRTIWPLHFILFIYSFWKKTVPNHGAIIIYEFSIISLIIPLLFLYENLFLSYRFLMPLCLMILIWIPFALEKMYQKILIENENKLYKILSAITILAFIGLFIGAFTPPKQSKAYIKKAGIWLRDNVPMNYEIYSNRYIPELSYYSDHKIKEIKFPSSNLPKNSYIIFCTNGKYKLTTNRMKPVIEFHNKEGKIIIICKTI